MSKYKDFFKPEDFSSYVHYPQTMNVTAVIAIIANEKLKEYTKSDSVVYGHRDAGFNSHHWNRIKHPSHTHTGVLMFIEELTKLPCKHEPMTGTYYAPSGSKPTVFPTCVHCGEDLILEWKIK